MNGVAFTRLTLTGGGAINPSGHPELPVLTYRVAIPYCDDTEVAYQILSTQTMPSCWVYPVPEMVLDSNGMLNEQFAFEPRAYARPRIIEPSATITSFGALRSQKYAEITVYPIEFCPVTRQLSVIDQIEITLTFTNPQGDLRQNVGIFNKVATRAFINYEDNGVSALVNDKAFEKPGFTRENVQWFTLSDTAQAATIPGDYLIITVPEFFDESNPNSQLERLAEHRAWYNGFDVSIVNVEDIWALPFFYEGNPDNPYEPDAYIKEQKLRTFIRRVFEGKNAQGGFGPHGDGHLAYVLLVGDYADNVGIPGSLDHKYQIPATPPNWPDTKFPSDYYYSCITMDATGYDAFGDLFIGRFSVEDTIQLFNIVEKTIYHETEYHEPQPWRKTAGFNSTYVGFGDYWYNNYLTNVMYNSGWNYTIVKDIYNIKIPTISYLNAGASFVQYCGLPNYSIPPSSWEGYMDISFFLDELRNDYKVPFINCVSSNTGRFDNMECMGEFLTRYHPSRGAVGYMGPGRMMTYQVAPVNSPANLLYQEISLDYFFNKKTSITGELLLSIKESDVDGYFMERKYGYLLFGDPALNILAEGCRMYVHDPTQVINYAYEVPDDCILYIHENGKLTVEEGGALVLGNRVQVIGVNNQIVDAIHVKGGDFIVGEDVVFVDLPGGILLENAKDAQGLPVFDKNKKFDDLKNATFDNTPLTHRGSTLHVDNCIFNEGSNVKSEVGVFKVADCTFNGTTFWADHTVLSGKEGKMTGTGITIGFSQFNGNNNNSAVQLINTWAFEIYSSTISGYETGISLTKSGTSLNTSGNIIAYNDVSDCNTGIELFNSTSFFNRNKVYNCINGVKLFNNSYTIFDNGIQPDMQIIQDCDSIEIYACATSFPTIFRYNKIVDVNNLGLTYMPLIYWDVEQPYPKERDIRYNCWGKGFDPSNYLYPPKLLVWDPVWDCTGKSGSSPRDDDEELYLAGLDYFANEDYTNAESTFKELIQTYSQSHFAIAALHELFALEHYTNLDFYSLNSYYASFTPSDSNLFNTADFLATRCMVKERDWQPAVDWYEERITNPPSYQDSVFAVIDLGDIHLMMESDTMNGGKSSHYCHYSLPNIKPKSRMQYEENKTSLLATLPQIKKSKKDVSSEISDMRYEMCDRKGVLGECVPNPANGNATISYEIFTGGVVEIQLFNSVGQLVKSLPQGKLSKGNYKATISVVGLPVGVYHYTLVVDNERVDGKKVVVN